MSEHAPHTRRRLIGVVVIVAVAIAGVLLVFSFLIVPSVASMLFSERLGVRLAIGERGFDPRQLGPERGIATQRDRDYLGLVDGIFEVNVWGKAIA